MAAISTAIKTPKPIKDSLHLGILSCAKHTKNKGSVSVEPTVTCLEFEHSGEAIDDGFAKSIAEMIVKNKNLTTLELKGKFQASTSSIILREAMKNNTSIKSLVIETPFNTLDDGLVDLSEVLKSNTTLTSLEIYVRRFSFHTMTAIANMLKKNKTLTTLKFKHTAAEFIDDASIKVLADAVSDHPSLTSLRFSDHVNGDIFAEALKYNTVLEDFYFPIDAYHPPAGYTAVRKICERNYKLKKYPQDSEQKLIREQLEKQKKSQLTPSASVIKGSLPIIVKQLIPKPEPTFVHKILNNLSDIEEALKSTTPLTHIHLQSLDKILYHPDFPLDPQVQRFVTPEESRLSFAMCEIEDKARAWSSDSKIANDYSEMARKLLTYFSAISQLLGYQHVESYCQNPQRYTDKIKDNASPITNVGVVSDLQREAQILILRLCQRVDWLLDLEQKANKPFDPEFHLQVIAADKEWRATADELMDKLDKKVCEMLIKYSQIWQGFRKVLSTYKDKIWPHSEALRKEIERAGFVVRQVSLTKIDRCVCETCGVEIFGLRPWHKPWDRHNKAKHTASSQPVATTSTANSAAVTSVTSAITSSATAPSTVNGSAATTGKKYNF